MATSRISTRIGETHVLFIAVATLAAENNNEHDKKAVIRTKTVRVSAGKRNAVGSKAIAGLAFQEGRDVALAKVENVLIPTATCKIDLTADCRVSRLYFFSRCNVRHARDDFP